MDKRKRRLLCMLEGSGRKSRWISGVLPLSFRAFAAGTLKNYRIYGNTVDGESVGDRTGNLFDEIYTNISDDSSVTVIYKYYYVGDGTFTLSSNIARYEALCNLFLLSGNVTSGASSVTNGVWAEQSRTVQSINGYITIGYRNYFYIDPRNYHTMLNSGSEPLPYEPYGYKVPITVTNSGTTSNETIYLPEQIKMVGDEAEYVDYAEQTLHRIGADDVDVTLPALPTLPGTNVLSVGTAVQPSEIEVKGKIKAL